MPTARFIIALIVLFAFASPGQAETIRSETGDDAFFAGNAVSETLATDGDGFLAGRSVTIRGDATGDLHVAGFDVSVTGKVAEDLYATGATVAVRAEVGRDLTALAFTLRLEDNAQIAGNARLFGETVILEGPIRGAVTATGRSIVLNGPIDGDVRLMGQEIHFGDNATIGGTLTYSTQDRIDVPERVVPADRVRFEAMDPVDVWDDWQTPEMPGIPTARTMFAGFLMTLLFYVLLGALALSFVPDRVENLRQRVFVHPGRSLLAGILGLSLLFGILPAIGLTIIGLPFVPFSLVILVAAWTLGYGLGAYTVALRLWDAFGGKPPPTNVGRLSLLAIAVTLVALLNFIRLSAGLPTTLLSSSVWARSPKPSGKTADLPRHPKPRKQTAERKGALLCRARDWRPSTTPFT